MSNQAALTRLSADAIADATVRVRLRLLEDGEWCNADEDTFLLLNTCYALAEEADLARREAELVAATRRPSPWIERLRRELADTVQDRIAA